MLNKNIIKKIKYSRLKPEEKFLIKSLIKIKEYKTSKSIIFLNGNEALFEYVKNENMFWIDQKFFNKFYNYNINITDIRILFIKLIKNNLNINIDDAVLLTCNLNQYPHNEILNKK